MRPRLTACLALLSLGLLASCALEEHEDYGVLFLNVHDTASPDAELRNVSVYLDDVLAGRQATVGPGGVTLNGLNVEREWRIEVRADFYEIWQGTFRFVDGEAELDVPLSRGGEISWSLRARTAQGDFLPGLPVYINDSFYARTPTSLGLNTGTDYEIEIRREDGSCERARLELRFEEAVPPGGDTLLLADQLLELNPGHAEALILLNEQPLGSGLTSIANPVPGLLSAYLPGHVYPPGAPRELSGLCDEAVSFSWTPLPEGFGEGQLLPTFELDRADEGQLAFHAYRGRVVLVNFWFINCVPCQEELPMLQEVLTEYHDEGFRIVALNPVEPEGAQRAWVQAHPEYTLDFLLDLEASPIAGDAAITYFPTNFVVDRRGVIRQVSGELHREDFEPLVQQLLAE